MIKQIKSSDIKNFVENNPETVLLDVRTEDEWNTVGKPDTKDLRIKSFFITISQDPSFLENIKKNISVDLKSMWIVEQQPGEYNPIHTHTQCDISAVMYLKVPEFLPSEKPDRGDDGAIYFVGGTGITNDKLKMSSLKIKPKAGYFLIFPASLMHTVYPYKTNDNFARRSVSFNAGFEYHTDIK